MNKNRILYSALMLLSVATIFVACKRISYKKLPNGSTYYVGKGNAKSNDTNVVKMGKFVSLHYTQILKRTGKKDSVVVDTRKLGKTEGLPMDSAMIFNQDPKQDFGLRSLLNTKIGDSVVIIQKIESIVKDNPQAEKVLGKKGTIQSIFSIVKIYNTQQEYLAETKIGKIKEFDDYIAKNNLAASFKPADSIYVTITQPGVGAIGNGNFVKVFYTGKTTSGKVFDSNVEDIPGRPAQPGPKPTLDFSVGKQEMIPGFDAAMKYFTKGSKGTIVMPYQKGYGEQGNQGIAPFEALVFDIEVVDVLASKPAPPPSPKGKPGGMQQQGQQPPQGQQPQQGQQPPQGQQPNQ